MIGECGLRETGTGGLFPILLRTALLDTEWHNDSKRPQTRSKATKASRNSSNRALTPCTETSDAVAKAHLGSKEGVVQIL